MKSRPSNYDKFPFVTVPNGAGRCVEGWEAIVELVSKLDGVIVIDCYPGVDEVEIKLNLGDTRMIRTEDLMKSAEEIQEMVDPFLGGEDPVFGYLSGLNLIDFFDTKRLTFARDLVAKSEESIVILGIGASLVHTGDTLIYADLARWEAQLRFRRNATSNIGARNEMDKWSLQYKRAFFIDWRAADRHKKTLISKWDHLLDTNSDTPKLADGNAIRDGLEQCLRQPFRVVPFFDPAPWGGQWMKDVCDLDRSAANYGWCFDCVPEENSLLLKIGDSMVEIPSLDLVFYRPKALLGHKVYARFGDEFPIRFDFLDTMGGGNLSFQVHPSTEYIQSAFGMHYTQDESYYILDAGPDATVYLGVKDDTQPEEMVAALKAAQAGEVPFEADRFANKWPAKKHDHFLIPAGTVHCSGAETMVLEISATPYIFTFKLWDWGRLGLDGKPRPIYLEHGEKVIEWDRDAEFAREHLINHVEDLGNGEERTGLHEMEFIETRRHWFTDRIEHHTNGGVNVLNLVEGEEAIVESPTNAFEPFVIHFAETFIVPASVGGYTIRPSAPTLTPLATIKAYVRT